MRNESSVSVYVVVAASEVVGSYSPVSVGAGGKSIEQRNLDLYSLEGGDSIKADDAGEGVGRRKNGAVDAAGEGRGGRGGAVRVCVHVIVDVVDSDL